MKKIAVTQRLTENDTYFEQREALDINFGKLFEYLGLLMIPIPVESNFSKYFEELPIDGVLLTGGNDLSSQNKNGLSMKRDNFEKEILSYCIDNKIPIMGLCRGMQIIAEYFGCSLAPVKNHVGTRHKLKVNQESEYFHYLDNLDDVNSFHNYAVDNVTDDLIISARSEDDVIMAIEHKKHRIFAQMWHSERENPFNKKELELIKKVLI